MTLLVFLPLLWTLVGAHHRRCRSSGRCRAAWCGWRSSGRRSARCCFAVAGVRLPGLNFQNQRVEAAYRKELVYGEDDAGRAEPPTVRSSSRTCRGTTSGSTSTTLYFNVVRYAYLQVDNFFILLLPRARDSSPARSPSGSSSRCRRLRAGDGRVPVPAELVDDDRRADLDPPAPARLREPDPAGAESPTTTTTASRPLPAPRAGVLTASAARIAQTKRPPTGRPLHFGDREPDQRE